MAYNRAIDFHWIGLAFVKRDRRAGISRQVTLADRAREHLDCPSLDARDPIDRDLVVSIARQLSTAIAYGRRKLGRS